MPNLRVAQKVAEAHPDNGLGADIPVLLWNSAPASQAAASRNDQGRNRKSHEFSPCIAWGHALARAMRLGNQIHNLQFFCTAALEYSGRLSKL
jgi:hypothetical protein